MAKIYGLFGAMTGKLADTVMSVRNGEQIARKYQPSVFNPSTPSQVATRAKLKLLSQLGAVLNDSIAFRKRGGVSSRNLFTKANYGLTTYATNQASIDLANVDLTGGIVPLTINDVRRSEENLIVTGSTSESVSKVYVAFYQGSANSLREVKIVETNTNNGAYTATIENGAALAGVAFAYGIRFNNEAAKVRYSNLIAELPVNTAIVTVIRSMFESDISLTETAGILVTPPNMNTMPAEEEMRVEKKKK